MEKGKTKVPIADIDSIYNSIIVEKKRPLFFIGAGFSRLFGGLSWDNLANKTLDEAHMYISDNPCQASRQL